MKPMDAALWPMKSQRDTPLASGLRDCTCTCRANVAISSADATQPTTFGFMTLRLRHAD